MHARTRARIGPYGSRDHIADPQRLQDELGVHPRKVQDVANWINEAYNPKLAKYRRLLVLSGPTGAAKTATLRVLAEEHDIDILEYRNSGNLEFANDDCNLPGLSRKRGPKTRADFDFSQLEHRLSIISLRSSLALEWPLPLTSCQIRTFTPSPALPSQSRAS